MVTPSETWHMGDIAVGTYQGVRVHARYGTSPVGPLGEGWQVIEGDLFGWIPTGLLADIEPCTCPAKNP